MVQLGLTNSRMKDFYDLIVLSRQFSFPGDTLRDAIRATFTRRATPLPQGPPIALTAAFGQDEAKRKQWDAFRKRNGLTDRIGTLEEVIADLATFLIPPLMAATASRPFPGSWPAGGPWVASG